MKLVFLGTGCSTPSVERNLSSIALKSNGMVLLFDCPEGTQRQMMMARVSYMKVGHIFLSHLHADHILGLAGLIATMSLHQRDYPLFIYGPKGVRKAVESVMKLIEFNAKFDLRAVEVGEGKVVEEKTFTVSGVRLKHEVPCIGYVFEEKGKQGEFNRKAAEKLGVPVGPLFSKLQQGESVKVKGKTIKPEQVMDYGKARKGKKVSVIMDTLAVKDYHQAIKDSDVLVHEASFLESMKSRAKETKHSTAKQAADVAAKTGCKKLVLTHISARHKDLQKVENEARQVFGNVVVAEDLMEVEV